MYSDSASVAATRLSLQSSIDLSQGASEEIFWRRELVHEAQEATPAASVVEDFRIVERALCIAPKAVFQHADERRTLQQQRIAVATRPTVLHLV